MLNLTSVNNLSLLELNETYYDVGVFASGYESRSTFLARNLNSDNIKHKLILGFEESADNEIRKLNDDFYSNNLGPITILSGKSEQKLYAELIKLFIQLEDKTTINVLVDYTSMSRLWYSGILNFFRFQNKEIINVYLNYSLGEYDNSFLDYSYSSINSLPSHEGSLSANSKTLLVLAVGFSPYLIKSVIEEIEPNEIIGILALPNPIKEYEAKTIQIKDNLLTKDIDNWINCPIDDLEFIFRSYTEIVSDNINDKDIMFLSLGPKIFSLASILVSQRFEQVTCLYLNNSQTEVVDIKPCGTSINNKVVYKG